MFRSKIYRYIRLSGQMSHHVKKPIVSRSHEYQSVCVGSQFYSSHSHRSNGRDHFGKILTASIGLSVFWKKKKDDDDKAEDDVILLIKHAKLSEMKQEYQQAEDFYHRALSIVHINRQHNVWDENRELQARIYIYDGMANLALLRGQLENSEKLFKQVLQGLLQEGKKPNDNAIIEVSLKLAVIYAAENRKEEASTGYQFCIESLEEKIKDASNEDNADTVALLGMCADAYSRYLIANGDYREALTYLDKALGIATNVLGDGNQQVAVLLSDIATVLSLLNDYDGALTSLQRAIAISEQTDSIHLPVMYCNLGALYLFKGLHAEAHNHYSKAFASAKLHKDDDALEKAEKGLLESSKGLEK